MSDKSQKPADSRPDEDKRKQDEQEEDLDQALEETFPASDPISP